MKYTIEKSTMEKVIRQVAEKEIGEIVGTLCSFLIGLMKQDSPKEAEELFRKHGERI